jgi:hypothetical protein
LRGIYPKLGGIVGVHNLKFGVELRRSSFGRARAFFCDEGNQPVELCA